MRLKHQSTSFHRQPDRQLSNSCTIQHVDIFADHTPSLVVVCDVTIDRLNADSLLLPFFVQQRHSPRLRRRGRSQLLPVGARILPRQQIWQTIQPVFIVENCGKIDIIRQYGFDAIWEFPCEWSGVAVDADASETVQHAARGGLKLITVDLQNRTFVAIRRCRCAM